LTARAARMLVACLALSACRQVLGIHEAELASPAAAGQAGDASDDDASSAPAASLCERYCDAVMTSCAGAHAVYASRANCLDVCAALPPGVPGDSGVDSVECRLDVSRLAAQDPDHCSAAGPYGGPDCGDVCISFCGLREQICGEFKNSDVAVCLQDCAKLPDLGSYSSEAAAGQQGGPHLQCRVFHVAQAASGDAAHECGAVDGDAPCQ